MLGISSLDQLDSPTPKKSGQVNTAGPRPVHGANMGSIQARNTSSSVKGAITWFRSQRMSVRQRAQERGARVNIQDNNECLVTKKRALNTDLFWPHSGQEP